MEWGTQMNAHMQVSLEPQPVTTIVAVEQAAIRLADEGIPVRAIARSLKTPSEDIYDILKDAILTGTLIELPVDDWPPGVRRNKRASLTVTVEDDAGFQFACTRAFKVTKLEIAVLSFLLNRPQATKDQLYHTIKQTRPGENRDDIEPKIVDVVICHLRKKLRHPHAITIETIYGTGYLIPVEDRRRALAIVKVEMEKQNG